MTDYIIVGAGPCGLSIAWLLAKYNKKCIIIEREKTIGGCHRVRRVDGLFTEHGPRIYVDGYLTFRMILEDMKLDFYDLFTEYNFNVSNINTSNYFALTLKEKLSFMMAYFNLSINNDYGKRITVLEFMENHNFTEKTKKDMNRICLLTDGANSTKYTLFEFLQLVNQQLFYKIYQPKQPNDIGLFKKWEKALLDTKMVTILYESEVVQINNNKTNQINEIIVRNINSDETYVMQATNYIFALPPKPMTNLLIASPPAIMNAFGNINDLKKWTTDHSYTDYISISFHCNEKIDIPHIWGFPNTIWGVAFVTLTDYMTFNEPESKIVISSTVTLSDIKSDFIGKTANECTQDELISETLRQLQTIIPIFKPQIGILSPGVHKINNKWINKDTAYIRTVNDIDIKPKSNTIDNLYWVGMHNGRSPYHFTSLEATVANGVAFVHDIIPESKKYPIKAVYTLIDMIRSFYLLIILIILLIIIKYYK